jgi:hypothetical protein
MKRVLFIVFGLFISVLSIYSQNTTNNTITINGNVYYFKPSTSPSSPLPRTGDNSNWIGDGEWWGEDAAKAWASIVDWVVLHCYEKFDVHYNKNTTNAYINRLSAERDGYTRRARIKIYFWLVGKGKKMEEGKPDYQLWKVEF